MFTVYILRSETSGRYYIGCTEDLERRLREHEAGQTQSTRGRGPWLLIHQEAFADLKSARGRELQIKAWKSRQAIDKMIRGE